jgi:hypothetical protein
VLDGTAGKIAHEQVTAFLYEVTAYLETQVKENTPIGVFGKQGGLYSTIHGEVTEKGTEVQKGIVAHGSVYGDPAERGRRPGKMPPSSVLVRWVELKLGVDEKEAKSIAFAIALKIKKKGTKGSAMFFKALDEGWPTILNMAQGYGIKIADKMRV